MAEPSDDVVRVAEMFGDLARSLAGEKSFDSALELIVDLAIDTLEHCEAAGITLVERGRAATGVNSGHIPQRVDEIQNDVGEGPCLDAIRDHEVLQTGDLAAEERWPGFARRAFDETGVRSVVAVRLYVEADTMGVLNLYSTQINAFDEHDVALAAVFAAHAAVAMSSARREERLERKVASRDVIGRAKGILMAQSDIDDDAAFDLLRRASQRLNIKLAEVAADVVRRHDTPPT